MAVSTSPTSASLDVADRQVRRHSPYHVKIACDACAVAILLGIIAIYLSIALLA